MKESKLRKDIMEIFIASLDAVDPASLVRRHVNLDNDILQVGKRRYDLSDYSHIYVVGFGKAAASMSYALEGILEDRIDGGIINVKRGYTRVDLRYIEVNEAGHPVPDEASVEGTIKILRLLQQLNSDDLVIFVISGGGSSLLCLPREEISLEEKQTATEILLRSGACIDEINVLRKHLSRVKGGQLAKIAYPAASISLILSDVVGDRIDAIASGPTVPDKSTFRDCMDVIRRYSLDLPKSVVKLIERGVSGEIEETPKADDPIFERTHNIIIGNNMLALKAAERKARELGYNTLTVLIYRGGEQRGCKSSCCYRKGGTCN